MQSLSCHGETSKDIEAIVAHTLAWKNADAGASAISHYWQGVRRRRRFLISLLRIDRTWITLQERKLQTKGKRWVSTWARWQSIIDFIKDISEPLRPHKKLDSIKRKPIQVFKFDCILFCSEPFCVIVEVWLWEKIFFNSWDAILKHSK